MKKNLFLLSLLTLAFFSCNQDKLDVLEDPYVEVTVKVVDAICSDMILEIQEENLKNLGDSSFTHEGNEYNGVIHISGVQCLPPSLMKNIYKEGGLNKSTEFKIKITKIPNRTNCEFATCLATFNTVPNSKYYILSN